MAVYDEQPGVAEEPQHDDDDDGGNEGGDDFGMDLLQRARLLCQAANEIALPMLQSVQQLQDKFAAKEPKPKKKTSRPSTREEDDEKKRDRPVSKPGSRKEPRAGDSTAAAKLPAIGNTTKLPQLVKPKPPARSTEPLQAPEKKRTAEVKPLVKKTAKKMGEPVAEEEAVLPLPKSKATDEWRKECEAEKIRQAQERAEARILRVSKQVELAKSNQQSEAQTEEQANHQDSDERQKQVEANRRRAEERVRRRKLDQAEENAKQQEAKQEQVPERPPEETAKRAEAFRQRTLQRLQAAKREAQQQEEQAAQLEAQAAEEANPTSEKVDAEEAERQRKRLEKRRRKETAERLKRQQQIAEEQQRKEQEIFEKGLNEFKTKKKEQDRVAKGLQPTRPKTEIDERNGNQVVLEREHDEEAACAVEQELKVAPSEETPEEEPPQDAEDTLSIVIETDADLQNQKTDVPLSSGVKTKPKKLPPWKKPCVPILPAESYSQKAILSPSDSYAERFRSGRSSPNATPVNAVAPSMPSKLQQARAVLASTSEN